MYNVINTLQVKAFDLVLMLTNNGDSLSPNANAIANLKDKECAIIPPWAWNLISNIFAIIKIGIPVLLVILGAVELGKAVVASDEKKQKEAQKALVRKILYGLAVFLLATVITWLLKDWLGVDDNCLAKIGAK